MNTTYDHLKPQLASLLHKISKATTEVQEENPQLASHELFVVLYEGALAAAGQILGSAFAQNPAMNQADAYNKAMTTLKHHTDAYHGMFLETKEKS